MSYWDDQKKHKLQLQKEAKEFREWYADRKEFYERISASQVRSEAWQVWWPYKHEGMAQIQSLINEKNP